MYRLFLSIFFSLIVTLVTNAQTYMGRVEDSKGNALPKITILLLDNKRLTTAYTTTKINGSFSISVPQGKVATELKITSLGYEPIIIPLKDFKNEQVIKLSEAINELKEIEVKPMTIRQHGDTIDFLVSAFKKEQDRSIAEVIARMAGLTVSKDGSILYQGKAINKFYIEGMDLMGSKYSMVSKNLTPDKVKKVQVLENHQPIKALKDKTFSESAALNLVLTEDAKNIWQGTFEAGVGMTLGEKPNMVYDGRMVAMLFGKKIQSVSIYKINNTGKDIKEEITSHSIFEETAPTEYGILSNYTTNTGVFEPFRTAFNRSHVLGNTWLFKPNKDQELRTQLTGLIDKTTSQKEMRTIYTDVVNDSLIEEISNTDSYRTEFTAEALYRINNEKLYFDNTFKGYIDFNHSNSITLLNQKNINQSVQPRKRYITDRFYLIKNMKNNHSFSLKGYFSYNYLPSELLIANNTKERLNLETMMWGASTNYRQPLGGMDIHYQMGVKGKKQQIAVNNFITDQTDSYLEQQCYWGPNLTYINRRFNLSIQLPINLYYRKINLEDKTKLMVSPSINVGFSPFSKWDIRGSYFYTWSPLDLKTIGSAPLFIDYITMYKGDGKLEHIQNSLLSGAINYKDVIRRFFASLNISYFHMGNVQLKQHKVDPTYYFYQNEVSDIKTHQNSFSLNASLSKNMYWLKSSVKLSTSHSWFNNHILLNQALTPMKTQSGNISLYYAMNPSAWFSSDITSTMNYTKQLTTINTSLKKTSVVYYSHNIKTTFILGKWQLQWVNDIYHSNDKSITTALFSDINLRYVHKKIEFNASIKNIFNYNAFERKFISDLMQSYTIYKLRPRETLFSMAYSM